MELEQEGSRVGTGGQEATLGEPDGNRLALDGVVGREVLRKGCSAQQALLSKGSEVEACLLCAVSSGRSLCPKPRWESSWRRGKGEGRKHHMGPLERPQENQILRRQAWRQNVLCCNPGFNSSN